MPTLDSAETHRAFTGKLGAEEDPSRGDHRFYVFRVGTTVVATTKISRGSRHTISDDLVARMARQLGVTSNALSQAVSCSLGKTAFHRLLAAGVPFKQRPRLG